MLGYAIANPAFYAAKFNWHRKKGDAESTTSPVKLVLILYFTEVPLSGLYDYAHGPQRFRLTQSVAYSHFPSRKDDLH